HVAGLHVPDLDRVILAARCQPLAIRAERYVQTRPGRMREESTEWFLRLSLVTKPCRVPQFDLAVAAHRSQVLAVGAEHHSPDHSLVDAERADRLADRPAVVRVPDLHESLRIPRDQVSAVGAKRYAKVLRPGREPAGV